MSNGGAYEDEMGTSLKLNDHELDRLLAGQEPGENGDLEELATFFRELTVTFRAVPAAATESRHLSAIMDAVRIAPTADESQPMRRRFGRGSRPMTLAFAAALALGLFGGAAYAGELPGPAQHAVANVASRVGLALPGAHNNKDDGATNDKQNGQPSKAPTGAHTGTSGGAQTGGDGAPNGNQGAQNQGPTGADQGNHGNSDSSGSSSLDQGTEGQSGGLGGGTQGGGGQGDGPGGGANGNGNQ